MTAARRILLMNPSSVWASSQVSTCFNKSCNSLVFLSFSVRELIEVFISRSWNLPGK